MQLGQDHGGTFPTCRPHGRPSFTLVELLVVIAIIAILAALATSGLSQVMSTKIKNSSEQTVQRVASGIRPHWEAVISDARQEVGGAYYNQVAGIVQNKAYQLYGRNPAPNADMLRNTYILLRLEQEFPSSVAELTDPAGLPPLDAYKNNAPPPGLVVKGQLAESSALLYLALKRQRRGQAGFNPDTALGPSELTELAPGIKGIVDAWGNPLTMYRVNAANLPAAQLALFGWQPTSDPTVLQVAPVIISAGKDNMLGAYVGAKSPTTPITMQPGDANSFDDILSVNFRQ